MSTEDITKLPKWAQRRIQVAEMRVEEANQRIREMVGDAPGSTILVHRALGDRDKDLRLPANALVRFLLGDDWIDGRVQDRRVFFTAIDSLDIRPSGGTNPSRARALHHHLRASGPVRVLR